MQRTQKVCAAVVFAVLGTGTAAADRQPTQDDQSQQRDQPKGAQQPAAQGEVMAQKMSLTATVEDIDLKSRKLTLRNKQGNQVRIEVPESAGSLDAIKKGDRITIDYYESIALMLQKPEGKKEAGKEKTGAEDVTISGRSAGALPAGVMARHVSATVEIMKIDKQARQVTIKGPEGKMDTVSVDPSMDADLAKLKKGDKITASYNEAVAIKVTPPTPKSGKAPESKAPESGKAPE